MTGFIEYDRFDGLGLAELIRKKEISVEELCEEAIRRAELVNPKLNAIILPMYDQARKYIKKPLPEGPFTGVPFLLKDAHHAVQGEAMSQGSKALKGSISGFSAEIVKRFKEAGLVVLGKTNTPEFKLDTVTEPEAFGPTLNPWDTGYTCGGSSGGSAAAVAARVVPMASGTDEGGSIRIPASCCALFGLKPSRGRNPVGPDFKEEFGGISTSHVLTRSVRDSAAMLDIVSVSELGAPYSVPAPERPFLEELNRDPGKIRIAFNTMSNPNKKFHPECVNAVNKTANLLESLGHNLEEAAPDFDESDISFYWSIVVIGQVTAKLEELALFNQCSINKLNIELRNKAFAAIGSKLNLVDYIQAKQKWREIGYKMAQFFKNYDAYLTPTLGQTPVLVGSLAPASADKIAMKVVTSIIGKLLFGNRNLAKKTIKDLVNKAAEPLMPQTMLANITGLPAMSVPMHWTESGLPCGVQFVGRYADEAALFRLAAQLEKEQPWFDKKPEVM